MGAFSHLFVPHFFIFTLFFHFFSSFSFAVLAFVLLILKMFDNSRKMGEKNSRLRTGEY